MADMLLFAVVRGDSPASRLVFPVIAPIDISVGPLKKLVYAEKRHQMTSSSGRSH